MSDPIDYTKPENDRRKLHRLRELVRGSAESARLLEQLLAALEQLPTPPAPHLMPTAAQPLPPNERIALALARCQQALGSTMAVVWRWNAQRDALSLVDADGLPSDKLAGIRQWTPRPGHPLYQACKTGQPQALRVPGFLAQSRLGDATLPPYGLYVPLMGYGKNVGVLLLGGNQPLVPVAHQTLIELGRAFGALLSVQPV